MKKTSAQVLALLFASSKAVKLTGNSNVPGYEAVSDEAEGVHVLDLGMRTMSNSPKDAGEWAFPGIRTAFYAQTGAQTENSLQIESKGDKVPGYESVDDGAEGVHVLDLGMRTMSNSPKDAGEWAFPGIRTAFYAQTGAQTENGLSVETEKHSKQKDFYDNYDVTAVNGPPKGLIGQEVYEVSMSGTDGIPNGRDNSIAPTKNSFAQRRGKIDPISPENYDPWVYKISKDNMGNFPQWHFDNNINWSSQSQKKHNRKHHKKDVAERGMDEEVHGFVADNVIPINTRVRSTLPFIPNGSSPSAFEGSAFSEKKHHRRPAALTQHKKKAKDMGERGYDEEVYDFASGLVSPINGQERSSAPYAYNGISGWDSDDSFAQRRHHKSQKHHKRPDVAERGMDEEVHGFVKEYTPPLNEWTKSKQPFIPNGSDPSAQDSSFAKKKHHRRHHKKDVAERGMDEEVHGLVWHAIPPLNTRVKSDDAFIPNGSAIGDWDENAFAQRRHRQSLSQFDPGPDNMFWGEHGMSMDQFPYFTSAIPAMSERPARLDKAPDYNGVLNQYPGSFAQTKSGDFFDVETGMPVDAKVYYNSAISAQSDRPARLEDAPQNNGYKNVYGSFAQKKDIAERDMESDYVHPFASKFKIVEPTANPWLRPYLPYEANGASNVYAQIEQAPKAPTEAQAKDIAHREVRPDVWNVVHEQINPVALGRFREPRQEEAPEVRTWDEGPKPKEKPTEFKLKKAVEVDEEVSMAKARAKQNENIAKHKEEVNKKEEEDSAPDVEAIAKQPKSAAAKKDEDAEKRDSAIDKEEAKAGEDAEKDEKAAKNLKAEIAKEVEESLAQSKSKK